MEKIVLNSLDTCPANRCVYVFIVLASIGLLSPANRGALLTSALYIYVFLGSPVGGYVSARIYKSKISDMFFIMIICRHFCRRGVFILLQNKAGIGFS